MGEMPCLPMRLAELPGAELIDRGLVDLSRGKRTRRRPCSYSSERRGSGRPGSTCRRPTSKESPEDRLYALLGKQHDDGAQGIYNALIRRLVAFTHAADSLVPSAPTPPS